jgi:hypothetical protein
MFYHFYIPIDAYCLVSGQIDIVWTGLKNNWNQYTDYQTEILDIFEIKNQNC